MRDSNSSDRGENGTSKSIRTVPRNTSPARFPTALAAQIGDRSLWIGNEGASEPENLDTMKLDPTAVITVNRRDTEATTDHHPLKDGYINDQEAFTTAVDATRRQIREGGNVLVNCAAGISRSATVIATAIAAEDHVSLSAAIDEIRQTRERAQPHTKLQVSAYAYLKTVEDRDTAATKLREIAGDISLDYIETERICEADGIPIDAFDSLSEFAETDVE
jgi:Predicted protein-tyrosine phosphatase